MKRLCGPHHHTFSNGRRENRRRVEVPQDVSSLLEVRTSRKTGILWEGCMQLVRQGVFRIHYMDGTNTVFKRVTDG